MNADHSRNLFIRLTAVCLAFGGFFAVLIAIGMAAELFQWAFPKKIVEQLNSPVYLAKIESNGLTTTSGVKFLPPGITQIPPLPWPLQRDLYQNGIERKTDGTCIGLFKIHHWCGNDPVKLHLARGDLSSLFALVGSPQFEMTAYGIDAGSFWETQLSPIEIKDLRDTEREVAAAVK